MAKKLIGKIICRVINDENLFFKIVETEAYQAPEDKACHAYKGKTNKTKYFWSIGGICYIFHIYMHNYYCFNIISNHKDIPHGVLIRAVEPYDDYTKARVIEKRSKKRTINDYNLYNGPVKSGMSMEIDKSFNGEDLISSEKISLYEDKKVEPNSEFIECGPRINIPYSEEWISVPWRFYIKDNPYVSKNK